MAKINCNNTATAGSSSEIVAENNARKSFYFRSRGDEFVLNFGSDATADNILHIGANQDILLDKSSPFCIEKQINVYCANASKYDAQVEQ